MREGDVLGFLDQHTGFYPDPAHFIYELLQNAEDMEATEVSFKLFPDKLIFEHNGTKRENLSGICIFLLRFSSSRYIMTK